MTDENDNGRQSSPTIARAPLTLKARTGGAVDYVLLWGLRDSRWLEPRVQEVLTQLDAGYELIHRSQGGLALLYRARKR